VTTGSAFVAVSPGIYRLQAPLTFASVASLRGDGIKLIESTPQLTVDLQGVPHVDSAGLALLIDWLATARAGSHSLKYEGPPQTLLSLARLSDVEKLIV
jgi:phospholipid transport system transporter-binding protein